MSEDRQDSTANEKNDARELAAGVHWITHATFWSQIGLGFIGIAALVIYHGQLAAMRDQLTAMNQSSEASSKQFQVQLQHFDASLGVNQTQIAKLDSSIQQSKRLADATEQANRNAKGADRPWLGGQVNVTGFEVGKNPEVLCDFINGGRRPAFVEHQVCDLVGDNMSTAPYSGKDPNPNGLVLPGGNIRMRRVFFAGGNPNFIQDGNMTSTLFSLYSTGQWRIEIHSSVIYRDIGTGISHHTTMCVRYNPAIYKSPASWTDCDAGNHAD